MIPLERGTDVEVVAETLANGAPHPHHGKVGVVLEVRDMGLYPVRVQVAGRPVMFAANELRILPVRPGLTGESAGRDSVSPVSLRHIDAPGM